MKVIVLFMMLLFSICWRRVWVKIRVPLEVGEIAQQKAINTRIRSMGFIITEKPLKIFQ